MILVVVTTYFAIGLALVFMGPAARELKRELFRVAIVQAPAWKLIAFRLLLSLGIVVLWPVLVPSAMKIRKPPSVLNDNPQLPSRKVTSMIADIEANHPKTITLEEYNSIGRGLSFSDAWLIREAMEKRGYLVAMAATADGRVLPVTFHVASMIGMPIVLTENRPGNWSYTTSRESWQHLAGRAGDAVVKDGVVVSVGVSIMN